MKEEREESVKDAYYSGHTRRCDLHSERIWLLNIDFTWRNVEENKFYFTIVSNQGSIYGLQGC